MMLISLNAAYSCWGRFLRQKECKLLQLPEELLIGEIFKWLSVRDIVRLRQVCKILALLTKKSEIWKRFLPYVAQIRQQLAPLPPTRAYALFNLTGQEMEAVVARAISYDVTWKRRQIECRDVISVYAHHHVQEVVILPGGHFLAMSVKTFDGRYGLVVWSLEHRETGKPAPLLFRETGVKAYGLTAKYMKTGDNMSLIVAFLRKKHKEETDTRYIPETFEMGGKEDPEDPYMPLKYECTALAVSLCVLDQLNNRKAAPMTVGFKSKIDLIASICDENENQIWVPLARIRTGTQLGVVSLDVIGGFPFVCVVKRPDEIIFEFLHPKVASLPPSLSKPLSNPLSTLKCRPLPGYALTRHSIWNFRVLPEQFHVLVVRNIEKKKELGMANDHLAIEVYNIPSSDGTSVGKLLSFTILRERQHLNVQISDLQRTMHSKYDESITPDLKVYRRPQPLSIFLRTQTGMAHHSLWPEKYDPGQDKPTILLYDPINSKHVLFGYNLTQDTDEGEEDDHSDEEAGRLPRKRKCDAFHFVPGARRAFVYTIPHNYRSTHPPITSCRGFQYHSKERTAFLGNAGNENDTNLMEAVDPLETDVLDSPTSAAGHLPDSNAPYHPSLDIPPAPMERGTILGSMKLPDDLEDKLLYGVSGVSFDEDSGRLILATKVDNHFHVVDFASTRPRDADDLKNDKMMDRELKRNPHTKDFEIY